jgi:hypothetical protein
MKNITIGILTFCVATSGSQAAFTQFDFGTTSSPAFGSSGNLTMDFSSIATGVNARLTAASVYNTASGGDSSNGLININFTQSSNAANFNEWETQPVRYTFELFDAGAGDGFTTPLILTEWGLDFFDIDRNDAVNENNGNRRVANYDIIGLPSTDTSASIVVPPSSVLVTPGIGTMPDEANFDFFSGQTDDAQQIANVSNYDDSIDATQTSVGLGLLMSQSSSVEFYYGVGIAEGTATNRNRNALIGGFGQLSTLTVPEPSSSLLLGTAGSLLLLRRHRS